MFVAPLYTSKMEFRDVMYFQVVAEMSHVGRAAERLNMTQPALSKCIARLEREIGGLLFLRTGRRLELTSTGRLLLERSRPIGQLMEETTRALHDQVTGAVGHVRIGTAATTAEDLLPLAIDELMRRSPEVTVGIRVAMNDVLHAELAAGQLDLVVGPMIDATPGVIAIPLDEDAVTVIARSDHPIHDSDDVLRDLAKSRWLLPARSVAMRQWLDGRLEELGMPPARVQVEANTIANLSGVIFRSELVSFASRRSLKHLRATERLREVDAPELVMHRHLSVSRRAGAYMPAAAVALLKILRAQSG